MSGIWDTFGLHIAARHKYLRQLELGYRSSSRMKVFTQTLVCNLEVCKKNCCATILAVQGDYTPSSTNIFLAGKYIHINESIKTV